MGKFTSLIIFSLFSQSNISKRNRKSFEVFKKMHLLVKSLYPVYLEIVEDFPVPKIYLNWFKGTVLVNSSEPPFTPIHSLHLCLN